jgi:hypothetical protein
VASFNRAPNFAFSFSNIKALLNWLPGTSAKASWTSSWISRWIAMADLWVMPKEVLIAPRPWPVRVPRPRSVRANSGATSRFPIVR